MGFFLYSDDDDDAFSDDDKPVKAKKAAKTTKKAKNTSFSSGSDGDDADFDLSNIGPARDRPGRAKNAVNYNFGESDGSDY